MHLPVVLNVLMPPFYKIRHKVTISSRNRQIKRQLAVGEESHEKIVSFLFQKHFADFGKSRMFVAEKVEQ